MALICMIWVQYTATRGRENQVDVGMAQHIHHPHYDNVHNRLDTYIGCLKSVVRYPLEMAQAGFFYAGGYGIIKCFYCDGGLRNWLPGDIPWVEHARWFPCCGFVKAHQQPGLVAAFSQPQVKQQPLASGICTTGDDTVWMQEEIDQLRLVVIHKKISSSDDNIASEGGAAKVLQDVPCNKYGVQLSDLCRDAKATSAVAANITSIRTMIEDELLETVVAAQYGITHTDGIAEQEEQNIPEDMIQINIQANKANYSLVEENQTYVTPEILIYPTDLIEAAESKHPKYRTVPSRLRTFAGWPHHQVAGQKPTEMAQAGFFYYGVGDCVKCFYCDGVLHNWLPGDDPWVEHARWFPSCAYIIKRQGSQFIIKVQQGDISNVRNNKSACDHQ